MTSRGTHQILYSYICWRDRHWSTRQNIGTAIFDKFCHIATITREHGMGRVFKTLHRMLKDFWWPKIGPDIKSYVAFCHTSKELSSIIRSQQGCYNPMPLHSWHKSGFYYWVIWSSPQLHIHTNHSGFFFHKNGSFHPLNRIAHCQGNSSGLFRSCLSSQSHGIKLTEVHLLPDFGGHCSNFWMLQLVFSLPPFYEWKGRKN